MQQTTTNTVTKKPGNGKAPAMAPTRIRSKESELKLQMRKIQRELVALDKRVEDFEDMKKEMSGASSEITTLNTQLGSIKAALIAELGLG